MAVRGDGGGGADASIPCLASWPLDLGHQTGGPRSLGPGLKEVEIPWNDGRFRAAPCGTMLLVRFWGVDPCFCPGFMRLRCDSILCENSATPHLLTRRKSTFFSFMARSFSCGGTLVCASRSVKGSREGRKKEDTSSYPSKKESLFHALSHP